MVKMLAYTDLPSSIPVTGAPLLSPPNQVLAIHFCKVWFVFGFNSSLVLYVLFMFLWFEVHED